MKGTAGGKRLGRKKGASDCEDKKGEGKNIKSKKENWVWQEKRKVIAARKRVESRGMGLHEEGDSRQSSQERP